MILQHIKKRSVHLQQQLALTHKRKFFGGRKKKVFSRPSATFQDQYNFLAESLRDVKEANSNLPKFTTEDLTLRLAILSLHRFRLNRKGLLDENSGRIRPVPLPGDEVLRLSYHVKLARAAYARDLPGLWWRSELSVDECELLYHSSDDVNGKFHLPIHFIMADHKMKRVVLSIRGSKDMSDIAIGARIRPLEIGGDQYHGGIATAAVALAEQILPRLENLIQQYPDYEFSITGHSLGAGTAALMAILLRYEFDCRLKAVCFACPPVCSLPMARASTDIVTTVINGHDFVPRFSAASLAKLKREVNDFDWKTTLQNMAPDYQQEVNNFAKQTQDRVQQALMQAVRTSYKASELLEIATMQLQVSRITSAANAQMKNLDDGASIGLEEISKNEAFYLRFLGPNQVKNVKEFLSAKMKHEVLGRQIDGLNTSLMEVKQQVGLASRFSEKPKERSSSITGSSNNVQWVSISRLIPKLQDEIHKMFTKRQQLLNDMKTADEHVSVAKTLIYNGESGLKNIQLLVQHWKDRIKYIAEQESLDNEGGVDINYEEDLFPAGTIYAILHEKESKKRVLTQLNHEYFEKLLLSPKMVSDHLLLNYRLNLEGIVQETTSREEDGGIEELQ
mmetsp:Transcript_33095/g.43572  ORF Transcript_33095/g.43572 Transcript_33095/m.43572 type:complete len:620 (-) Transcript_33095:553-2412(-)